MADPRRAARIVLALASVLVPRDRRGAWRREWDAELTAARERGRGDVGMAFGAVPDAWALRRTAVRRGTTGSTERGEAGMGGSNGGRASGAVRELRRALRSLLREPGFTWVAVLTLTVGLGATAALVTLVDAILLRPLAIPAAERVVRVYHTYDGGSETNPVARFALPFLQENERSFEVIGAYWSPQSMTLTGDGAASRVQGVRATPELLAVLGATPVEGRLFNAGDAEQTEAWGVVLSHRLWTTRYGADPSLVGRTIPIDGEAHEVLGVMAADVDLPTDAVDLWIPYAVPPGTRADDAFRLHVLARLDPGVTLDAARADLDRLMARFPEVGGFYQMFIDQMSLRLDAGSIRAEVVGEVERPLWILLGAVLIVLAVAAANVATLFLVRAERRRREVAVRAALGAGRGRLLLHFLTEGFVVAAMAGAGALLVGAGAVRLFSMLAPPDIPRLDQLTMGAPTVGAVVALSLAVAAALGLYPFLRFGRADGSALRSRVTGESRGQAAVGGGLVVTQVALALVLLSGSALLTRTLQALRAVDPGFDPRGVLVAEFSLPEASYPSSDAVRAFQDRLLSEVEALPGVHGAALGPSPLAQPGCNGLFVEGRVLAEGEMPPCVPVVFVSPGYWDVLGIAPVAGRTFTAADAASGVVPVAVVSDNVAQRLWPDGDVLSAGLHPTPRPGPPWFPVVGVTDAVRGRGPDQPATDALYLPVGAMDDEGWLMRTWTVLVETDPGDETRMVAPLRQILAGLDPSVPLTVSGSLAEQQARTMRRSVFTLFMLGTAAAATLVLGLVGLYGVVSYRVGTRRAEIGLRMALGAEAGRVRRMILGRSLRLVALGTVLGVVASLLLSGVLSSLLFGVAPGDPLALAAAAAALLLTAVGACWIPAQRATRVDPVRALRSDG